MRKKDLFKSGFPFKEIDGEFGYIIPVNQANKYNDTYYFKKIAKSGRVYNTIYCELEYDRSLRKYCAIKVNDFCATKTFNKDDKIFVGFTY